MLKYAFVAGAALLLALLLTPLVRRLALRLGAVDEPGGRHLHSRPTARLGGVALLCAFVGAFACAGAIDRLFLTMFHQDVSRWGWILGGALVVAAVGCADDLRRRGPGPKLCVQLLAALLVLAGGHGIEVITNPLTGTPLELGVYGMPLTIVWVVGVTNAFNRIDGLDGLAAGVALIVAATLFVVSLDGGHVDVAILSAALAGALAGFLYFNFNPATMFLGDSGSLLLGYLLAVLSIQSAHKGTTAVVMLVPVLALGLPIMDTLLAMLRRTLRVLHVVQTDPERNQYRFFVLGSASIFRADRDHIHHRLMASGWNHRRAVLVLYAVCVAFGVVAFLAVTARGVHTVALVSLVAAAAAVGVRKLGYQEMAVLRRGTLLPLFELPVFNRRVFHAVVDATFAAAGYWASFMILAGGLEGEVRGYVLRTVLPVVAVKLIVFACVGVYERSYRHTDARDVLAVTKAVVQAQLAAMVVLLAVYGMPPVGRGQPLLDFYSRRRSSSARACRSSCSS
jgi:UDP-GlcNAc:undecaprenyl-phosphate GlcNAc-1-phosphate transferase